MNGVSAVFQTRLLKLAQQVRPLTRLPKWAWGGAALAGVLLIGRLMGGGARPEAQNTLPDTTLLAFDAIAKLGVVLGLFFVGVYAARRWRRFLPNQNERRITVVESTRLSQRQALHLVRVGDELLLIGATDQGLALLTKVAPPAEPSAQSQPPADFYTELALRRPLAAEIFDFSAAISPETR